MAQTLSNFQASKQIKETDSTYVWEQETRPDSLKQGRLVRVQVLLQLIS